jgi:hypothetical protein
MQNQTAIGKGEDIVCDLFHKRSKAIAARQGLGIPYCRSVFWEIESLRMFEVESSPSLREFGWHGTGLKIISMQICSTA